MPNNDLFVAHPKSGLYVPSGAETELLNKSIAEQYRRDATTYASKLLNELGPEEVASFLWVKNTACDVIAEGK